MGKLATEVTQWLLFILIIAFIFIGVIFISPNDMLIRKKLHTDILFFNKSKKLIKVKSSSKDDMFFYERTIDSNSKHKITGLDTSVDVNIDDEKYSISEDEVKSCDVVNIIHEDYYTDIRFLNLDNINRGNKLYKFIITHSNDPQLKHNIYITNNNKPLVKIYNCTSNHITLYNIYPYNSEFTVNIEYYDEQNQLHNLQHDIDVQYNYKISWNLEDIY